MRIVSARQHYGLDVWLGGMFESGVGRALNLQFASQAPFHFPGDLSASDRYFYDDIVTEPAKIKMAVFRCLLGWERASH